MSGDMAWLCKGEKAIEEEGDEQIQFLNPDEHSAVSPSWNFSPQKNPPGNMILYNMPARQFDQCDFDHSPLSTASQGLWSTPFSADGLNPFELSFSQGTWRSGYDGGTQASFEGEGLAQNPNDTGSLPSGAALAYSPLDPYSVSPQLAQNIPWPKCLGTNWMLSSYITRGCPTEGSIPVLFTYPRKRRKPSRKQLPRQTSKVAQHRKKSAGEQNVSAETENVNGPNQHPAAKKQSLSSHTNEEGVSDGTNSILVVSDGTLEKEKHKLVEMKYRQQMKERFEELLRALPVQGEVITSQNISGGPVVFERKMKRGKVLDMARARIDQLEKTQCSLEEERLSLQNELRAYEAAWMSSARLDGSPH